MIRGTKQITPKKLNYDINFSIHNRFDVEVIDSRTGEIRQKVQAHNVICVGLWDVLFSKPNYRYFYYIGYGSGSGTPSVNDTALFHQEGYKQVFTQSSSGDIPVYNWDEDDGVISIRDSVSILETESVGVTITEVGILSNTSSKSLSTHAMLKDMNGNEISIEKTATDIINIYATVFIHFSPKGYDNGAIQMSFWGYAGEIYSDKYKSKHAYKDSILSWLFGYRNLSSLQTMTVFTRGASFSGDPKGLTERDPITTAGAGVKNTYTVDSNNKTITFSAQRLPASNGNFIGGISTISIASASGSSWDSATIRDSFFSYNFFITPKENSWYGYTQITGEAVGTGDGETTDFDLKFPLARDSKLYVDGVETQATVDFAPNYRDFFTLIPVYKVFSDGEMLNFSFMRTSQAMGSYVYGELFPVYNPFYETFPVQYIWKWWGTASNADVGLKVSNDFNNWVEVENLKTLSVSSDGYIELPEQYQGYKFFWVYKNSTGIRRTDLYKLMYLKNRNKKAVHFETPPAAGSVITADYKTDTIAKDENHVFDFSLTIHLGEYSGA